ncbi:hypothetical protein L249_6082 [Ophiocordyceps polyrhachis-furcata BCC 54312]|uniref:Uncharacterized protein n=1 Tax=Ophiocordyceps polyrhachis-furcata BCC 54312 TaxID=1330021 RepID=A0A367LIN4_9HYPO|nr:hypothetical protein L249_6082 [Ophiocordyceps polyrhachis-furcata BCC 54312]
MLHRTITGFGPTIRARAGAGAGASHATMTGRRHFHLGTVFAWTADAMSSGHAIGLPWYIVIPLVAAGVNFAIRLPIHLYVSRLEQRRRQLRPLVAAWNVRHAINHPNFPEDKRRAVALAKRSRRRIFKEWHVQKWKSSLSMLSAAPFIVVTQALRGLCGAPAFAATGLFDQSLADGGCLWFVDLTAHDSYYALPLLCSGIMAYNIWGKLSRENLRELLTLNENRPKSSAERLKLRLTRVTLFFPLLAAASAYLPSAVFLYWATAFGLGSVNSAISRWRVFEIDPCPHITVPERAPKLRASLPYVLGRCPERKLGEQSRTPENHNV